METRPLEPKHAEAVHALVTRPEIARWGPATPFEALEPWTDRLADKGDAWAWLGAFEGGLRGCAQVKFHHRRRCIHLARVHLWGDAVALRALVAEIVGLADGWFGLSRLEASYEAESPQAQALVAAGFEVEATCRGGAFRDGRPRDLVVHGRLRPGWSPAVPGPMEAPPRPEGRVEVRIRPLLPADAEAAAALHRQPSIVAGTLMTPGMTATRWRAFSPLPHRFAAEVDGELVGFLALSEGEHRSVYGLGMVVDEGHQGRGVGGALLDAALDLADRWLGARRVELEVFCDNPRAKGLYLGRGFEIEGLRRALALRDGGYADALVMGRLRPDLG